VRKAVNYRDASVRAAAEALSARLEWTPSQLEQFRLGATGELRLSFSKEPPIIDAVRCWRTEGDWAKGPELGGWSDALLQELEDSDLRGMGGAGIPATQKWRDVRDAVRTARQRERDDRAFIVVNGDESEPGTSRIVNYSCAILIWLWKA